MAQQNNGYNPYLAGYPYGGYGRANTDLNFGNPLTPVAQPQYIGKPIDDIKQFATQMQTNYWENKNTADTIKTIATTAKVHEKDLGYKKEALDRAVATYDQLAESGDWATSQKMISDSATALAQDTAFQTAVQNQQTRDAWAAKIMADPKYTQAEKQQLIAYGDEQYQGVQEVAEIPGTYSGSFDEQALTYRPDIDKAALTFVKSLNPRQTGDDTFEIDASSLPPGMAELYMEKISEGKVTLTRDEITQMTNDYLMSNKEIGNYYDERANIGMDLDKDTELWDIASGAAPAGVRNDVTTRRNLIQKPTPDNGSGADGLGGVEVSHMGSGTVVKPNNGTTTVELNDNNTATKIAFNDAVAATAKDFGYDAEALGVDGVYEQYNKDYKAAMDKALVDGSDMVTINGESVQTDIATKHFKQMQANQQQLEYNTLKKDNYSEVAYPQIIKEIKSDLDSPLEESEINGIINSVMTDPSVVLKYFKGYEDTFDNDGDGVITSAEASAGAHSIASGNADLFGLLTPEQELVVELLRPNNYTNSDIKGMSKGEGTTKLTDFFEPGGSLIKAIDNATLGVENKVYKFPNANTLLADEKGRIGGVEFKLDETMKTQIRNKLETYEDAIRISDTSLDTYEGDNKEEIQRRNKAGTLTIQDLTRLTKGNVKLGEPKYTGFTYDPNSKSYRVSLPATLKVGDKTFDLNTTVPITNDKTTGIYVGGINNLYNTKPMKLTNILTDMIKETGGAKEIPGGTAFPGVTFYKDGENLTFKLDGTTYDYTTTKGRERLLEKFNPNGIVGLTE